MTQFGSRGSGEIEYDVDGYLVLTRDANRIPPPRTIACRLSVANARYGGSDCECDLDLDRDRADFAVARESHGH